MVHYASCGITCRKHGTETCNRLGSASLPPSRWLPTAPALAVIRVQPGCYPSREAGALRPVMPGLVIRCLPRRTRAGKCGPEPDSGQGTCDNPPYTDHLDVRSGHEARRWRQAAGPLILGRGRRKMLNAPPKPNKPSGNDISAEIALEGVTSSRARRF